MAKSIEPEVKDWFAQAKESFPASMIWLPSARKPLLYGAVKINFLLRKLLLEVGRKPSSSVQIVDENMKLQFVMLFIL